MKVLFTCKGNICRSPVAAAYLQQIRPAWTVKSAATTKNTYGQCLHPEMRKVCDKYHLYIDPAREVVYVEDLKDKFDVIYDLHSLGIEDPYKTGNYDDAFRQIISFINRTILI